LTYKEKPAVKKIASAILRAKLTNKKSESRKKKKRFLVSQGYSRAFCQFAKNHEAEREYKIYILTS
jgi:hypothetical protein